ncbi:MAG: MBL fold metallo-hydrolase [Phycisphaeraceae bacterium]|nr:MBL fold metallo-hydrolase [Phycisphaeraceae bacterium]
MESDLIEAKPLARAALRLCVLASGSAGNCSVLVAETEGESTFWLIDAGLSMKRTRALLAGIGLADRLPRGIILTHLDNDHANPSVIDGFGDDVPVFLHRRHLGRAEREQRLFRRTEVLDNPVRLGAGCSVRVRLAHHDIDGSAALRFTLEHENGCCELGYATDIGRPTAELVDHLAGVDVLAIESNYCPKMQERADRPAILKARVMGGSGHLSNQQCVRMVRAIAPQRHVVLLHLSRQCNTPELAAIEHLGSEYQLSVSSQHEPTSWIEARLRPAGTSRVRAETLFEA